MTELIIVLTLTFACVVWVAIDDKKYKQEIG